MTTINTPPPVKEIILKNIQSFPSAKIELPPPGQILVITGQSDAGKTALASRALRKLYFNDIPTKQLIRRGAKSASITATYDTPDNLAISWEWRGRSADSGKARYVIRRDGMDPIILEGANRQGNVPEQVRELTQVEPVKVGALSLNFNFNKQLDGPFLGSISPADRYRVLGALAGTLEVDQAVDEVGLEVLRSRKSEKQLDTDIKALEGQISDYDYLAELGYAIAGIQDWVEQIQRDEDRVAGLWALSNDIAEQEEVLEDAEEVVAALGHLESRAGTVLSRAEQDVSRQEKLTTLQGRITNTLAEVTRAKEVLAETIALEEASSLAEALTRNNDTLSDLIKLQRSTHVESGKLTTSMAVLEVTREAGEVARVLGRAEQEATLLGRLVQSQADISYTRAEVDRNVRTLEETAGAGECTELLVVIGMDVGKMRELQKLGYLMTRDRVQLEGAMRDQEELTAHIDKATGEYWELLKSAGICEDCPVVAEVMAAG